MEYKIKVYYIWEFGQRKDADGNPHQEDCVFPLPDNLKESDRCFVLCDGMGGHDAGEVASSTVCEAMGHSVLNSQPNESADFSDQMVFKAVEDAFGALDKKDTGAAKKMGTTMTFLKLHSRGAHIAHMGDSRVYHIRPGKNAETTKILFETKDHSLVNDLLAIGELTEEEAKTFSQKNVITRAMQPNMERHPKTDIYSTDDIQEGDYFYLCSDGMLENMEDSQICFNFSNEAGSDEEKVRRLTLATQENHDNHTAIIVHVMQVENPSRCKAKEVEPLMGEVHDEDTEMSAESATKESKEEQQVLKANNDQTILDIEESGKNEKGVKIDDSDEKKAVDVSDSNSERENLPSVVDSPEPPAVPDSELSLPKSKQTSFFMKHWLAMILSAVLLIALAFVYIYVSKRCDSDTQKLTNKVEKVLSVSES